MSVGGSSGYARGNHGGPISEKKIESEIETSIENTEKAEFEADINDKLKELLSGYNEKDAEQINERLQEISDILSDYLESSINIQRAGSWSKHTYVDGLSDVDCLFILNTAKFSGESPQQLLDELKKILQEKLNTGVLVDRGNLSLKITYRDGPELQILPALKNEKGVRIPSGDGDGWSKMVNPEIFAQKLTDINQQSNGNVIPVIKLAKGAMSEAGIEPKIKGYHTEALAVEIFQRYEGNRTKKAMLEYFFEQAAEIIKKPIREISGQSFYVDDYLGPTGSSERQTISKKLESIHDKMSKANSNNSSDVWFEGIGL